MCNVLRPYGKLFRIGGDEFVALLHVVPSERKNLCNRLRAEVTSWRGKFIKSLSLSYGYVIADENANYTFDEMVREADRRMYENKSDYYQNSGLDRRRR